MERVLYPKVSVIIPTYKRAKMLSRAIDSVLNQTYRNIEVIVVDDNNPNDEYRKATSLIMENYCTDERVHYICHEKNMNGSVARNTGMINASGEFVTFLDDDDFYFPNKVERQVNYLLNHPENHAVYCGWERGKREIIKYLNGDLSYYVLSGDQIILTNAIMLRRDDALNCGGWDISFLKHQEAAFLLRYFRYGGTIGSIDEVLLEMDISDRSNAVKDPKKNEKNVCFYLNSYNDMIERCDRIKPGNKKKIYCHRYRGILLGYIASKHYMEAISFYLRKCICYPLSFNACLLNYCLKYRRR